MTMVAKPSKLFIAVVTLSRVAVSTVTAEIGEDQRRHLKRRRAQFDSGFDRHDTSVPERDVTLVPTQRQTEQPSGIDSGINPSSGPTLSLSVAGPSLQPTINPPSALTTASQQPTKPFVSLEPSIVTPSQPPNTAPQTRETTSPATIPSTVFEQCSVSSSGLFGSESSFATQVDYFYQVTPLGVDVGATQINNEILPSLEVRISNSLLPVLFDDLCAPVVQQRSIGKGRHDRQLVVTVSLSGLSAMPLDRVVPFGEYERYGCQKSVNFFFPHTTCCSIESCTTDSATVCFVVAGAVTLYTHQQENTTDAVTIAQGTIADAMERKVYDDDEVTVRFLEGNSSTSGPDGTTARSTRSNSNMVWVWVLVVGLSVSIGAVCLAFYVYQARRRRITSSSSYGDTFEEEEQEHALDFSNTHRTSSLRPSSENNIFKAEPPTPPLPERPASVEELWGYASGRLAGEEKKEEESNESDNDTITDLPRFA